MKKALLLYGPGSDPDILYATGFYTLDPFIYIEIKSKRYVVLSDLETARAKRKTRIRVLSYSHYVKAAHEKYRKAAPANVMACILNKLKVKQIEVRQDFPYSCALGLKKLGFRLKVIQEVFRRDIKSELEIDKIQRTQRAAENAMAHAVDLISNARIRNNYLFIKGKPLTSEAVRASIQKRLIELGCRSPQGVIVSCGSKSAFPHEYGSGRLRANKPIIIDIFPRSEKTFYWGDMTRTVVRGKPSKKLKQMFDVVLEAQNLGFKLIRHNSASKDIHSQIAKFFDKKGFRTVKTKQGDFGFTHGLGHGVGLEIHEKPQISAYSDDILQKGNTVTVEPGLYYQRIGGVRIEDLVAVTKRGCRNLTKFDKFLAV